MWKKKQLFAMKRYKYILPCSVQVFKEIRRRNVNSTNFLSPMHVVQSSFLHLSANTVVEVHSKEQEVVIAMGSNMGDRVQNFNDALLLMKKSGITKLGPHELLGVLKQIEEEWGRKEGSRYGPRPIDLDILFYGKFKVASEVLKVAHERIWERPFVVAPLIDLLGSSVDNDCVATWHSFSRYCGGLFELWDNLGGESLIGSKGSRRVLPIGKQLWDWSGKTHVMGVINLRPDSFSDGGKFQPVEDAVSQVRSLISEGTDIIDLGAQSTHPRAPKIPVNEELYRLIPVLEAIAHIPEVEGKILSVDTFYSEVASEAVKRGIHIINDVSDGQLDPHIIGIVADLKVPYVVMHVRGEPSNMQNDENLRYGNVYRDVAAELHVGVNEAELSGILAWRMIIDPGIGFSKKSEPNLEILKGLPSIHKELGLKSLAASHAPVLVGPSRKRFLGEICNRDVPAERDPATVAAVTVGILGGADIVRVHNVRYCSDAARLCDVLLKKGV